MHLLIIQVADVVVYSYGTNRTFENLERPEDSPAPEAP